MARGWSEMIFKIFQALDIHWFFDKFKTWNSKPELGNEHFSTCCALQTLVSKPNTHKLLDPSPSIAHRSIQKKKKIINTHEIIDRKVILRENTSWSGSHEKLHLVAVYYKQSRTESCCEGQGTLTAKDWNQILKMVIIKKRHFYKETQLISWRGRCVPEESWGVEIRIRY